MFFEAILTVAKNKEKRRHCQAVCQERWRDRARRPESIPSLFILRILWPIDIVLVDCHECYGRKILEWSMCIKIQYLDFHRDPSNKKKELEMGCVSPQSSLTDCCSTDVVEYKRCQFVKSSISAVHLLLGNQLKSPLSEGLLNSRCLNHEYCGRHLLEVQSFWGV